MHRGEYVSKSGKFPDTGGIKGADYEEYQWTRQAIRGPNSLLPGARKHNGKSQNYNQSFIAALIDAGDGKTTFIPATRGGNVILWGPHKRKAGYVVQFSPFLFAHDKGVSGKKYQYYS